MKSLALWMQSWKKMGPYFRGYSSLRNVAEQRTSINGLTGNNSSRKITIATSYINFVNAILADMAGIGIDDFVDGDLAKIWTDFYSIILILDDQIDLADVLLPLEHDGPSAVLRTAGRFSCPKK